MTELFLRCIATSIFSCAKYMTTWPSKGASPTPRSCLFLGASGDRLSQTTLGKLWGHIFTTEPPSHRILLKEQAPPALSGGDYPTWSQESQSGEYSGFWTKLLHRKSNLWHPGGLEVQPSSATYPGGMVRIRNVSHKLRHLETWSPVNGSILGG